MCVIGAASAGLGLMGLSVVHASVGEISGFGPAAYLALLVVGLAMFGAAVAVMRMSPRAYTGASFAAPVLLLY